MNHHEKRTILLDLVFSLICKKLDLEECGHAGFLKWYDENSHVIDETVTHDVVTEYFTLQGEDKSTLSKHLTQRIIKQMKIAA